MELNLKRPIAFFDLETTGLNITHDRIVEVSVLRINVNGTQEQRTWRINPGIPIPPETTAIHGISDADVANEKTFKQAAPEISKFFGNCDLAGYNILKFEIGHEPHIPVGDDPDQLFLVVADRHARDPELVHHILGFAHEVFGMEEERVGDNAVFTPLHAVDFIRLLFDAHILVDGARAAFSCHGDRHFGFGNGIHRGAEQRDVQRDAIGESGFQRNIRRQNVAFRRNQQNVVKRQSFFPKLILHFHILPLLPCTVITFIITDGSDFVNSFRTFSPSWQGFSIQINPFCEIIIKRLFSA